MKTNHLKPKPKKKPPKKAPPKKKPKTMVAGYKTSHKRKSK